jgi:hypothetical protein
MKSPSEEESGDGQDNGCTIPIKDTHNPAATAPTVLMDPPSRFPA